MVINLIKIRLGASIFILLLSFFIQKLSPCCCDDEKFHQSIIDKASRLVNSAREAEKNSYSKALDLFKKALALIQSGDDQEPNIIARDSLKIGPYGFAELRDTIIPGMKLKADAEQDPLSCAELVMGNIKCQWDLSRAKAVIASAYANTGRTGKASEIIEAMGDITTKSWALHDLAVSYGKQGDWNEALRVALAIGNEKHDRRDKSRALAFIEAQCEKEGNAAPASQARSYLNEMIEMGASEEEMMEILKLRAQAYLETGQLDKTLAFASERLNPRDRNEVYDKIFHTYLKKGNIDKALEIIERNTEFQDKPRLIFTIAREYQEAGCKNKAEKYLSFAFQAAKKAAENGSNSTIFADIAIVYKKIGDNARAREALALFQVEAPAGKNEHDRDFELKNCAHLCMRAGSSERAFEVAKHIKSSDIRNRFYYELISMHSGDEDEILSSLAMTFMDDPEARANALVIMKAHKALSSLKAGYADEARGLFNESLDSLKALHRSSYLQDTWQGLALNFGIAGHVDEAREIIGLFNDPISGPYALSQIARHIAETGQLEEAFEIARAIKRVPINNLQYKDGPLEFIADQYLDNGCMNRALEAAKAMEDPYSMILGLTNISIKSHKSGMTLDEKSRKVLHGIIESLDEKHRDNQEE
jgi:tetratricopeptide (TPR) repeat protein